MLEVVKQIESGEVRTPEELQRAKVSLCRRHGLKRLPTNSELLAICPEKSKEKVLSLLRTKPTRTLSGVAVLALMTKPAPCPHGRCSYCPGGVGHGTPQSYTGEEPAALRAIQHNFDPYSQTVARLEQLRRIGHLVDKVDVIVMGGTFTSFDPWYRTWFIKRCLDGMNGRYSRTIRDAQELNERAESRCVGLTIETRPDCFGRKEVEHSMFLGATRVELGVQTTDDGILNRVKRGHNSDDTKRATKLSKDSGLKVCYHMMPGLPGSTLEKDMESFHEIFTSEDYRPDMIKIYPTLVLRGTELYESWKNGDYTPYHEEEVAQFLAEVKLKVPEWVRIQRIQRDIPAHLIVDGVRKGDVRLLAQRILRERKESCRCIRCREIGRIDYGAQVRNGEVVVKRTEYEASGGTEVFLSFEETRTRGLVAYSRLRISNGTARIRELKVFGEVVPIHKSSREGWQHRGYGKKLVVECERIAHEEWDMDELSVTSGVGARGYFRRTGYTLDEPYMVKQLG